MDEAFLTSWLSLQAIDGVGDRTLLKLIQAFGSPDAALHATIDELVTAGCSPELADAIHRGPSAEIRRQIDRQVAVAARLKIRILTFFDDDYPTRLKTIPDPPPLLYVSGTLLPQDSVSVAIVGGAAGDSCWESDYGGDCKGPF